MVLRLGILSFAHYHANFWSEAFAGDDRVVLTGFWDDDRARLKVASSRYSVGPFEDLEKLLANIDAVAICSETSRHRSLIEIAAKRGLAILCEKPLATTVDDAIAIERVIADRNVRFVQSFPKRLDPASLKIKELIDSGELGEVRMVRIRHGHSHALERDFTQGWWAKPELSGGGTLIDEGVHAFDFLRWLFGDPETIHANVSYFHGLPVEDAALAQLRWSNGLLADVATSWSFAGGHDSVEIYGSKATALLAGVDLASRDLSGPNYLRVARRGSNEWEASTIVPRFATGGFHHAVARNFIDCLVGASLPCSTVADGRAAVAIVTAGYESARRGSLRRIFF